MEPPAKEIITSSRDSIAVTKTIGVYLNGEATTRFQQESTVATRTQPTNGVGDDRPPLTSSIDQATVVVARERMQRSAEVGAYKHDRRGKPKRFYYPKAWIQRKMDQLVPRPIQSVKSCLICEGRRDFILF